MNKLEDMSRRRKEAHAKLIAAKSHVYKAFLEMERATYSDGALSKMQKELIAVGISVATDCESCMQWHIEQAAVSGSSEQEVLQFSASYSLSFLGGLPQPGICLGLGSQHGKPTILTSAYL